MKSATATKRRNRAEEEGWTNYSSKLEGDDGNYHWSIKADVNDRGYVGISQVQDSSVERVLLTEAQWKELVRFVRYKKPR